MKTSPVTPQDIARAVWSVPPLSLTADGDVDGPQNARLAAHIEAGGVSTLLWGGNANVYGMRAAQFEALVEAIPYWVSSDAWAIPSVGPDYGKLMDQAAMLRGKGYPAAMLLPYNGPRDAGGTERAVRDFVQASGIPAILYLRAAQYLPAERIGAMFADGTLVALKYAVETGDLTRDPWLDEVLVEAPRERIVSGIGELAAIEHLGAFPLAGFTAGLVCIAPKRATAIHAALLGGDRDRATTLAAPLRTLEDLRNAHGPIPVIHAAVSLSGIADMGPLGPHFTPVPDTVAAEIRAALPALMTSESDLANAA